MKSENTIADYVMKESPHDSVYQSDQQCTDERGTSMFEKLSDGYLLQSKVDDRRH